MDFEPLNANIIDGTQRFNSKNGVDLTINENPQESTDSMLGYGNGCEIIPFHQPEEKQISQQENDLETSLRRQIQDLRDNQEFVPLHMLARYLTVIANNHLPD